METQFLNWLLPQIKKDHRLEVPPGDDAAVLRLPGGKRTVVTTDLLTESVDFRFPTSSDGQGFPTVRLSTSGWQKGRSSKPQ